MTHNLWLINLLTLFDLKLPQKSLRPPDPCVKKNTFLSIHQQNCVLVTCRFENRCWKIKLVRLRCIFIRVPRTDWPEASNDGLVGIEGQETIEDVRGTLALISKDFIISDELNPFKCNLSFSRWFKILFRLAK